MEEQKDKTMKRYRSKVDLWLSILLVASIGIPSFYMLMDHIWIGLFINLLLSIFILHFFLKTYYTIEGSTLTIKSGILVNISIDIYTIYKIEESNNLLSSPALSIDRLMIHYNTTESVLISPKEKQAFITHMTSINNAIEVKYKK